MTGSRAPKAHWCVWGAKAGSCGPIPHQSHTVAQIAETVNVSHVRKLSEHTVHHSFSADWTSAHTDTCPLPKNSHNGHINIRTGQCMGKCTHMDARVNVLHLPAAEMPQRYALWVKGNRGSTAPSTWGSRRPIGRHDEDAQGSAKAKYRWRVRHVLAQWSE